MSYKCTLTFLNQMERKKKIIDMYNVALYTKSIECFCIVLMWMFEFICSYYYINTDEDVNLKRLLRDNSFSREDIESMNVWSKFRNEVAHCIFPLNADYIKNLNKCEPGSVFKNFEDNEETFRQMFKECCKQILNSMKDNNGLQECRAF